MGCIEFIQYVSVTLLLVCFGNIQDKSWYWEQKAANHQSEA
jgi:hypothetical protein